MDDQTSAGSSSGQESFGLRILVARPLYWAVAAHGIPPIDAITIENLGQQAERDLVVELSCEPPLLAPVRFALDTLPPGDERTIRLPSLVPDVGAQISASKGNASHLTRKRPG